MILESALAGLKVRTRGEFNVSGQNLEDWKAEEVLSTISRGHSHVQRITLYGNRITGLRAFSHAKDLYFLTYLNVSYNQINNAGAKALSQLFRNDRAKLSHMNLSHNQVGDEGIQALAAAILETRRRGPGKLLTHLDISENLISAVGAQAIANLLVKNPTLTYLNLSKNPIRSGGANLLGASLSMNTQLKILELDDCLIGMEGATKLARSLIDNLALTHLKLNDNEIEDGGAIEFAKTLSSNLGLKFLYLEGNQITLKGIQALAAALQDNANLIGLFVSKNNTSDSDESQAIASIQERLRAIGNMLESVQQSAETHPMSSSSLPMTSTSTAPCGSSSSSPASLSDSSGVLPTQESDESDCPTDIIVRDNGTDKTILFGNPPKDVAGRVKYHMYAACVLIALSKNYPTKKTPFCLYANDDASYTWTALMVLGDKLPQKFGHESLRVMSTLFDPDKEIGPLWWRYSRDSLYETAFKHHVKDYMCDLSEFPKAYKAEIEAEEQRRLRAKIAPLLNIAREEKKRKLDIIKYQEALRLQREFEKQQAEEQRLQNLLNRILPTTTEIDWNHLILGDEGAKAIASVLTQNRSITTLSLRGNKIQETGIRAIAQALEKNTTLKTLDLSQNQVNLESLTVLANALTNNAILVSLVLDPQSHQNKEVSQLLAFIEERLIANRALAKEREINKMWEEEGLKIDQQSTSVPSAPPFIEPQELSSSFPSDAQPSVPPEPSSGYHTYHSDDHKIFSSTLEEPPVYESASCLEDLSIPENRPDLEDEISPNQLLNEDIALQQQTINIGLAVMPEHYLSIPPHTPEEPIRLPESNPDSSITTIQPPPPSTAAEQIYHPELEREDVPSFFCCPMTKSGEPMKDPVSTCVRQTYERSAIEEWLSSNNTDPITNIVLPTKELKPNYAIRDAIAHYISTHPL